MLISCCSLQIYAEESIMLDRVVAVVNKAVILESELNQEIFLRNSLFQNPSAISDETKQFILENMINDLVLLQRAKRLNISVDSKTVLRVIKNISEEKKMSLKLFEAQLKKEGLNLELFKKNIEKEILLRRLRERELQDKLIISDTEAKNFLETQGKNNLITDEVLIKHLKFPFDETVTEQERMKLKIKVNEILENHEKKFKEKGEKFWAEDGREFETWEWKSFEKLPEIFVDSLRNSAAGGFVQVIESGSGFHLLFLSERRSSIIKDEVTVYKARHILKKVAVNTKETTTLKLMERLMQRIQQGESFSSLAEEFSDDITSAQNGGELNWSYPGDLVLPFERVALSLSPGEVSAPVRTMFGYHLIQLLEKKQILIDEQRQLNIAKTMIRERKIPEVTEEWIRDLRENSYVEIKSKEF